MQASAPLRSSDTIARGRAKNQATVADRLLVMVPSVLSVPKLSREPLELYGDDLVPGLGRTKLIIIMGERAVPSPEARH